MKLTSPDNIKKIMNKNGIKFNKALGQNFLTDEDVLHKMVQASGINSSYGALEIGPGIGVLTAELSKNAAKVAAVELDRRIAEYLTGAFSEYTNVEIINGNALKLNLNEIISSRFEGLNVAVAANLPYYITTPLIMKFLEDGLNVDSVTVMIQKEVAERIAARPGTSDYGALSVAAQYYSTPEIIAIVPPEAFIPPPKVTSAIIRLDIKNHVKPEVKDKETLFKIIKAAFAQRRKTLANALAASFPIPKEDIKKMITEVTGNENIRGEELGLDMFTQLADIIYSK